MIRNFIFYLLLPVITNAQTKADETVHKAPDTQIKVDIMSTTTQDTIYKNSNTRLNNDTTSNNNQRTKVQVRVDTISKNTYGETLRKDFAKQKEDASREFEKQKQGMLDMLKQIPKDKENKKDKDIFLDSELKLLLYKNKDYVFKKTKLERIVDGTLITNNLKTLHILVQANMSDDRMITIVTEKKIAHTTELINKVTKPIRLGRVEIVLSVERGVGELEEEQLLSSKLTQGLYRITVFINGKEKRNIEFTIQ